MLITDCPLEPGQLTDFVRSDSSGAVVTFLGTTRDVNDGKEITLLEYEAYRPMADKVLEQVAAEMVDSWNLGAVAIGHRLGPVNIGEISMVIATSSPHRRDAFEACQFAVKRIKQIVPIWKKEYFEDGEIWIGSQDGQQFSPLD